MCIHQEVKTVHLSAADTEMALESIWFQGGPPIEKFNCSTLII